MSSQEYIERADSIDRRTFVAGVGAGTAAGLAGCTGGTDDGQQGMQDNATGNTTGNESQNTTATKTPPSGGKPIVGMATAPNNLNVLASSTAYTFVLLDQIYTTGTISSPKTGKPIPWGFEDWTLKPENIGTSKPTITATLRDDLTWSDGKGKVTAEDVKFTVEYIKEQKPAGTVSASQFESVESVSVDKPKGTTVNYFLKKPDRAWLSNIVGNYILPKHRWKNVSNYSKYTPRKNGGPIGSGPMTLRDYSWENWFELRMREKSAIPWNGLEYTDWLHPDGPFVDGIRAEIFGSQSAMVQNLLDGTIDITYGTVPVEKAAQATNNESLKVYQSQDDGWHHHSFNTRRVPLDDPAFRQLLVKMLDRKWVLEELYKGLGAQRGNYGTPAAWESWRPESPKNIDGTYEGISVPALTFPGEGGKYKVDSAAIEEARSFLTGHSDAKHEYSVGPAKTGEVNSPDGKEIYVNGKPLGQAHTDNAGKGGQGPLEMSYNPPSSAPKTARLSSRWVEALKKVGIPTVGAVESFNSQLPKIYSKENFDMFEMGWTGITWINDHYRQFYSSAGADLKGNVKAQKFNVMGYTGADDLILKQAKMMEPEKRQPVVKKALAQIWHDAPTQITHYARVLQPVNERFQGHVKTVGGVRNPQTWLNIHKRME